MSTRKTGILLLPILLFLITLFFYQSSRTDREMGWTRNVLTNWNQYGFSDLKGDLVYNAGGLHSGENPTIYEGHRPAFLYLPYWFKHGFGPFGKDGLFFQLALATVVATSLYLFFGKGWQAGIITFLLCLSPGFTKSSIDYDPISLAAIMAIGLMPFIISIMQREKVAPKHLALASLLLVGFLLLNWGSFFSVIIAVAFILAKTPDLWARAIALLVVSGGFSGYTILTSIAHKTSHSTASIVEKLTLLNHAYLIGENGYNAMGMTWALAFKRLFVANLIAWLPLTLFLLYTCYRAWKTPHFRWSYFLPIAAGLLPLIILRNYNAHHQWEGIAYVGLGIILSIRLFQPALPASVASPRLIGIVVISCVYTLVLIATQRLNTKVDRELFTLVRDNTPRNSILAVTEHWHPDSERDLKHFAEPFDRKIVAFADLKDVDSLQSNVYLLSNTPIENGPKLLAHSSVEKDSYFTSLLAKALDFYRKNISKRAPTDHTHANESYWLYVISEAIATDRADPK